MKIFLLAGVAVALLSGCAAQTTANAPGEFVMQHAGAYEVSKQALMVDCVFDGFLASQSMLIATHVRQVKRADGWRIDVVAEARQFLVADIRDDGQYTLRMPFSTQSLGKEIAASKACLERFAESTASQKK